MFSRLMLSCLAFLVFAMPANAEDLLPEAQLSDSGLHIQPWFHEGFLELADDLQEAQDQGKDLLILIEQPGCPYCRELHKVNLRRPDTVAYLTEKFLVVQLDMRGSREVTDLDGTAMEERDLVRKWGVNFTPTALFVPKEAAGEDGPLRDHVAMTMPGYFKPFHFDTMLEFVAEDVYVDGDFQRYIDERADRLRAEGKDVDVW